MAIVDPFDPQSQRRPAQIIDPFEQQQPQSPYNPTDDMSGWERFMAGAGRAVNAANDAGEQMAAYMPGFNIPRQVSGMIDPRINQQMEQRIAETARIDKPLLDTDGGSYGDMAGNAALTVAGGLGSLPAKGAAWTARALAAAGIGAREGALGGILDPVQNASGNGFIDEKAKQVATSAGTGAAAGGVLNRAGAALEMFNPKNATAALLNAFSSGANKTNIADEGEALAKRLNVDFTPAQVSGGKAQTMAENLARQSIVSREIAEASDRKRVGQLKEAFDRTLKGVIDTESSPAIAGERIQGAVKNITRNIEDLRDSTARKDYDAVRRLTQGQKLPMSFNNTATKFQELLDSAEGIGVEGQNKLAAFAKQQLGNAAEGAKTGPAMGDLDKLLKVRQFLSKVSGGKASITGDREDKAIAVGLLKAIDQDIDESAAAIGGDLGGALSKANKNYRAYTNELDSVDMSVLGKILGEDMAGAAKSGGFNSIAPEDAFKKLAGKTPSELAIARKMLENSQQGQEALQLFKRGMLQDALDKAMAFPPSAGVNNAVLNPTKLASSIGDRKKLEALFTTKELAEVDDILNGARRLGDKTGYNFSGTAPASEAIGLMQKAAQGGIRGLAEVAGIVGGLRTISNGMANANGRKALLEMTKPNLTKQRLRELGTAFSTQYAETEDN